MQYTIDFSALRADRNLLVDTLRQAGAKFDAREMKCCCPFHDDKNPSAEVSQSEDGAWRFKCYAGSCGFSGDILDVRAKLANKNRNEIIAEMRLAGGGAQRKARAKAEQAEEEGKYYQTLEAAREAACFTRRGKGEIAETYTYANPQTGTPDLIVFRIHLPDGAKEFKPCYIKNGTYVLRKPQGKQPLYNRTRLLSASTIVLVEGEKCVHALQKIGVTATTSPGGSSAAAYADWSPLAGKTVYVWPDRDRPDEKSGRRSGIEYAKTAVAQIETLNPPAKILWLDCDLIPEIPEDGGDVADLLEAMAQLPEDERRAQIDAILQDARPVGAVADLQDYFELIIKGKLTAIPFPWMRLSTFTQALLPGSFTVLCGSPGATKSLMLMQALGWWFDQGIKVACMMLEDSKLYHLCRALAQRAQYSGLTTMNWVASNPEKVRQAQEENVEWLMGFSRSIFEPPLMPPNIGGEFVPAFTVDQALLWARSMAVQGAEIICLDPLSYLEIGERPWIADMKMLQEGKRIAQEYKTRVVVITHPRKHAPADLEEITLDDMGGWGGIGKFSHTSLWLHWHEQKSDLIDTPQGVVSMPYDRTLKVMKARNSSGRGRKLAFRFNPESLTLEELGIIQESE